MTPELIILVIAIVALSIATLCVIEERRQMDIWLERMPPCPRCKGRGVLPGGSAPHYPPCPSCNGTGLTA